MEYKRLGNADHGDCVRIMHRAFDEGINFVGTHLARIDQLVAPGTPG